MALNHYNFMKLIDGLVEGQVLQRLGRKGAIVVVSGDAREDGPLFATISNAAGVLKGWNARRVGAVSRGRFSAELSGIPAGGPYRLELRSKAGETARVKEFFVGDVWILSGQSNMQGCGNREGAAKPHPLVRAFSMRREWRRAVEPLHVLGESPDFCHHGGSQCSPEEGERLRESAVKGVGVGLFFGREMVERSGVPQGLICVAHGGTSMNQWNPERKSLGGESLYASMLASVKATGQPVAGVLWYQGESDATVGAAPLYTDRMKRLVSATRRDLRQPQLPWIIVQLARVIEGRPEEGARAWNSIQEQQRLLPRQIKNLETVAAIDLELDDCIHIGADSFPVLAKRFARVADRMVLGNLREDRPPQLGKITPRHLTTGSMFEVKFENGVEGLHSAGSPSGFALLDSYGKEIPSIFRIALQGDTAQIYWTRGGTPPVFISYGHGVTPRCNIIDGRGFSLPVFGPFALTEPKAFLPFVTTWKVSEVDRTSASLGKIGLPDVDAPGATIRTYNEEPAGFVNENPRWAESEPGLAYFSARLCLPEPMRLEFLMGYDGPFRLWLNGKPFFKDLNGTNPCYADESSKKASLAAGMHEVRIAMDINRGQAWGFFLRFARLDVTPAQIKSGDYAKAEYLI